MYIKAPQLSHNGSLSEYKSLLEVRQTPERYETQGMAEVMLKEKNYGNLNISGYTERNYMQSGRLDRGDFIDTLYSRYIESFSNDGLVERVFAVNPETNPTPWGSESFGLRFGYTGFFDSGLGSPFDAIRPEGSHGGWVGAANRLVIANAKAEAQTKVLNDIYRNLDLGESLVDIDKTAIMMAIKAQQVLKAWRAVRRGRLGPAFRHLGLDPKHINAKTVAEKWLALQYGWYPLIMDIYNGYNLIQELISAETKSKYVTARSKVSGTLMLPEINIPAPWRNPYVKSEAEVVVRAKVRFTISNAFWAFINSLSLLNPFYILWARVPFSFVVDWFIPVGDMLQALSATIGLQFHGGYVSVRTFGRSYVECSSRYPQTGDYAGYSVLERGTASCKGEALTLTRLPYLGWPAPMPYFTFPFNKSTRVASAVSLIASTQSLKNRG